MSQTHNQVPGFFCSVKWVVPCWNPVPGWIVNSQSPPPPAPHPSAPGFSNTGHVVALHMCPLRKDGRPVTPVTPVGGHTAGQLAHVSESPDSAGPKLSPSHAPATDPSLSLVGVSVGWGLTASDAATQYAGPSLQLGAGQAWPWGLGCALYAKAGGSHHIKPGDTGMV